MSGRGAPCGTVAVMKPSTPTPAPIADTSVVRLSGAQGIVAAVPQYLGFVPEQSLVLMCLTRPRGRVGPVARIDLPSAPCGPALAPMLECARRYADEIAIVCYHSGDRPACIDELIRAVRTCRIPVVATLSVCAGRIRDARSSAAMRRDPGMPLLDPDDAQAVALRSAAILAERHPLPSRQALAASIAPSAHHDDTAARRAIDTQLHAMAPDLAAAGRALSPALARHTDTALDAARTSYRSSGRVPATVAARLIAIAQHTACRDLLIARCVEPVDPGTVGLLAAVAAQCPDDYGAQWCAVLAAAAYRHGDGAMAQCALDRVEAAHPAHRMAQLLRSMMTLCLPPDALAGLADIAIPACGEISPDADEVDRSRP